MEGDRSAVLLELGQAQARVGSSDALAPLTEVAAPGEDATLIAATAIELSTSGPQLHLAVGAAREADPVIFDLRDPGGVAYGVRKATTLATLARSMR